MCMIAPRKRSAQATLLALTRFFSISNTFICNARLKLAKNHAKAKQQPEAEFLLFENHSPFSSTLSFKNNRRYSKMYKKTSTFVK